MKWIPHAKLGRDHEVASRLRATVRRSRLRLPRFLHRRGWLHRRHLLMFVLAAVIVGLIAALFAIGIRWATATFDRMATARPWLPFLVCPTGLAVIAFLTRTVFPGAQGSGIPQAMAGLRMSNPYQVDRLLSWRIAIGKLILVLAGFLSGASIGKEGPIVQIGCSVMNNIGRIGMPRTAELQRLLIAAGGAAGIAGIFNAPLAGAIFAIEEMSHRYDAVTGRSVLASAMLSGLALFAVFGASAYFGTSNALLPFGPIWLIILPAGLVGGLAGGLFAQILVRPTRFLPGAVSRFAHHHPVMFAFCCGLAVAFFGWLSGGLVFDASYDQARAAVHGTVLLPMSFAPLKWAANLASYLSGIPGGIFSPALAVGAGIGAVLQRLLMLLHLAPAMPVGAVAMIGMAAYFSGLVQSPITAAAIVVEMTNDLNMTVAVGLAAGLGAVCSKLICPVPVYEALARQFFAAVAEREPAPAVRVHRRRRRHFFK
ncbi:MAG: chloride channel protein [Acetobacteraceae bacterium]